MPVLRKDGPYIWTTWLSKLLVGDNSCEWSAWFKAQFDGKSWTKVERIGNLARWQIGHTDMLNSKARELREQGYQVSREAQNHFTVNARTLKVAVAGKCDLTARQGDLLWLIDVKSGRPRASDQVQVMIYMHLFPWAHPELQGLTIKGLLVYGDHEEVIEPEAVDRQFVQALQGLVTRLANTGEPAVKVPAWSECQFCDISAVHCPERVEKPDKAMGTLDHL